MSVIRIMARNMSLFFLMEEKIGITIFSSALSNLLFYIDTLHSVTMQGMSAMLNMRNRFERNNFFGEKNIHAVFEVSLLLKAILAIMEVVAGILTFFITPQFLLNILHRLTQVEFIEDRGDVVANYVLHAAQSLSISSLHFAAFYLLIHGIVKLWIIIGLWRKKLGYYPAAIAIFSLFIVYQLYRYTFTHSVLLILITVLDVVVIVLTVLEYRQLRLKQKRP